MLTINDIKEKKFEKSAFGYKMEDVENFLNEVIDLVVELQEEKADTQKKLLVLAEKIEEYRILPVAETVTENRRSWVHRSLLIIF